jgi:hypothetical protein
VVYCISHKCYVNFLPILTNSIFFPLFHAILESMVRDSKSANFHVVKKLPSTLYSSGGYPLRGHRLPHRIHPLGRGEASLTFSSVECPGEF